MIAISGTQDPSAAHLMVPMQLGLRAIKGNQGHSVASKGNQGRSHLMVPMQLGQRAIKGNQGHPRAIN